MLYMRLNCVIQKFIHASYAESKSRFFPIIRYTASSVQKRHFSTHYACSLNGHYESVQKRYDLWKVLSIFHLIQEVSKLRHWFLWHYIASTKGMRLRHDRFSDVHHYVIMRNYTFGILKPVGKLKRTYAWHIFLKVACTRCGVPLLVECMDFNAFFY